MGEYMNRIMGETWSIIYQGLCVGRRESGVREETKRAGWRQPSELARKSGVATQAEESKPLTT